MWKQIKSIFLNFSILYLLAQVDKVIFEITSGVLSGASSIPSTSLEPGPSAAVSDEEEEEDDMTAMQARLDSLRS